MTTLADLATRLDVAASTQAPVDQLSRHVDLSVADAYEVQRLLVGRRVERGEAVVGAKAGFTSRSKAAQMGVFDVISGRLTSGMAVEDGGSVDRSRFCHPRIEPEIAFVLGRALHWPVTVVEVGRAVAAVAPALEIIDSRYRDFRFALEDVIADNASAASFVVGPPVETKDLDNLGVVLTVDGHTVQCGSTAAILGHPLRSLVAMVQSIGSLDEGAVVLAGAATATIPLPCPGVICVEIQGLGRATVRIEDRGDSA